MNVDWLDTSVRINVAGSFHWPRGMRVNPAWSRWVFDHQLRLCTGGQGWIHLHEGRTTLTRGSCQWLRAGWDYNIEGDPEDPLRFLTIRFDMLDPDGKFRLNSAGLPPENLSNLDFHYVQMEMRRIVDDLNPDAAFSDKVTEKFGYTFTGVRRIRATARLTALLMELDEANFTQDDLSGVRIHPRILKLQRIARRMCERPGSAPTVEELAHEAEYTRAHFCRAFKSVTGYSPQEFLIIWRLRHARRMLVETSLSVKTIAMELGYCDSEHFSRQFRGRIGITPSMYRESNPPAF